MHCNFTPDTHLSDSDLVGEEVQERGNEPGNSVELNLTLLTVVSNFSHLIQYYRFNITIYISLEATAYFL